MKINKTTYPAVICVAVLVMLSSCAKWIDVKPSDRLSEDVLFETREGYLKALNGVYIDMAKPALYGQFMTSGAVDVMAQYYVMTLSSHLYFYYTTFNYAHSTPKTGFDTAWQHAYKLIGNLNVIIDKTDGQDGDILSGPYYRIVRGEALALRAMLHFDMLRLFGPIWSETSKSSDAIPYYTEASADIEPILSAEAVMERVLEDLHGALELLQPVDPILTEGVRNEANPAGSNDLHFRQYRLNYLAVKALLARAYLWIGETDKAADYANETLQEAQDAGDPTFPFVTFAAATNATRPDRVFSTEVMFSLYTMNRAIMYNTLFDASQHGLARLSFNAGSADMSRVNALYQNTADYRYRIWENVSVDGVNILTNQKYKEYVDAPGRNMLPLIRLGELYLIAAECADNLETSEVLINELRRHRNLPDLSLQNETELRDALTAEYRKELLGEGQMFFYYKRNAFQTVPNHAAVTGTKTMILSNYKVPLPDSEVSMRSENQ